MNNPSIDPAASPASVGLGMATLAGMGWALSYLTWTVALPLWLVGSVEGLYTQRPRGAKEWLGWMVVCVGAPATAYAVYRRLAPAA